MKLLFDENLSPKLPLLFATKYPGSVHVRDCGLKGFADEDIWEFARAHGLQSSRRIRIFTNAAFFMPSRQNSSGFAWAIAPAMSS
jgi:hypothetical protein